jgi:hypothetical protein
MSQLSVLYVADFAPADRGAGPTQMYKLLADQPADRLFLITSHRDRRFLLKPPFNRFRRFLYPHLTGEQLHGYGRILMLLDRILLPFLVGLVALVTLSWRPQVILSVAHGYFFLAAALVRRLLGVPLALIVHDDWIALTQEVYWFRKLAPLLYRWALRQADLIYAVSDAMKVHLKTQYGVDSQTFFPVAIANQHARQLELQPGEPLRIAFTGTVYSTVREGIALVADAVNSGQLASRIGRPVEFLLSTRYPEAAMREHGWLSPQVRNAGWLPGDEYEQLLASADLLLVPIAFHSQTQFYADTSFPSKLADYTASGRPVLLIAPPGSTTWDYCQRHGNAIFVSEPTVDATVSAIAEALSANRLSALAQASREAFERNHNVVPQRRWFFSALAELSRSAHSL